MVNLGRSGNRANRSFQYIRERFFSLDFSTHRCLTYPHFAAPQESCAPLLKKKA